MSEDPNIKRVAEQLGISPEQVMAQAKKVPVIHKTLPMPEAMKQAGGAPKPFSKSKQLLHNRFMGMVHNTITELQKPTAAGVSAAVEGDVPNEDKPVISEYMHKDPQGGNKMVLARRKVGEPSILQECRTPIKLIIHQHQSPGDILMVTSAIRDLHQSYPDTFVTDINSSCPELWQHNPYITKLDPKDTEVMHLRAEYSDTIANSNSGSYHFIHGFRLDFEAKLGIPIKQGEFRGEVHLSPQERAWLSQIWEIYEKNIPYWIIDAGTKSDFTNKQWEWARFQDVVNAFPDITWVQIGARTPTHRHPPLEGDNVINLVGKTTQRQLVRLMYHAAGVLTPVSFPMHLSAAVPVHPRYRRRHRPCIVINGGREPTHWEAYPTHQFLHCCGALPCCQQGGCWKSRIEPLGDGDKKDVDGLCERPHISESGQLVPMCMEMISPDMVKNAIRMYRLAYDFTDDNDEQWAVPEYKMPIEAVKGRLEVLTKKKVQAEKHIGKEQVKRLTAAYKAMLPKPKRKPRAKKTTKKTTKRKPEK